MSNVPGAAAGVSARRSALRGVGVAWGVVCVAVGLAAPARAQPSTGGRWTGGVGVGVVARPATCYFCSGGVWPTLSYRVGRTLRYDAVVAFEGIATQWSGGPSCTAAACLAEPEASFFLATHAVALQWWPRTEYPFFVKAGFGVSTNHARYTFGQVGTEPRANDAKTIVSLTPKIGGGVERRVSPETSVVLHVDVMRAVRGRIAAGDASLSATLLYFGVALSWYP